MDCFVASAPRNDEETLESVSYISGSGPGVWTDRLRGNDRL